MCAMVYLMFYNLLKYDIFHSRHLGKGVVGWCRCYRNKQSCDVFHSSCCIIHKLCQWITFLENVACYQASGGSCGGLFEVHLGQFSEVTVGCRELPPVQSQPSYTPGHSGGGEPLSVYTASRCSPQIPLVSKKNTFRHHFRAFLTKE